MNYSLNLPSGEKCEKNVEGRTNCLVTLDVEVSGFISGKFVTWKMKMATEDDKHLPLSTVVSLG